MRAMADFGHVTSTQHIHGYCGLCVARCGTVAVVENGGFARLEPDPAHPTGEALCAKGRAAPELVCHSEKLTSASPASNRRQSDSLDARAPCTASFSLCPGGWTRVTCATFLQHVLSSGGWRSLDRDLSPGTSFRAVAAGGLGRASSGEAQDSWSTERRRP